jgi:hypothetical protein
MPLERRSVIGPMGTGQSVSPDFETLKDAAAGTEREDVRCRETA